MKAPTIDVDLAGRRILVIEDEYYLAMELQDEIEQAGGAVIGPCADAKTCLTLLKGDRADAAIVDINLGNGPSFEVADALRSIGVPFLFLTGYDAETVPDRLRDVLCVQKPANIALLLRELKRSLLA